FLFYCSGHHRTLHSFPTRRSSDLEVADRFCRTLEEDGYGFAVVNFANPDMVGHSGVIPAVVKAVATTDACLGRVVETVQGLGGRSEEHTSELQSRRDLVCRLLLEK